MVDDLSENAPARAAGSPAPRTGDATGSVWHRPQPAAAIQDMPLAPGATPADTGLPATIGPASLRQAAANGEPAAQFEVAVRFAEGRGMDQDYGQAFTWYQRAAMRGHAPAQFRLAMLLRARHGRCRPTLERAKRVVRARRRAGPRQGHAQSGGAERRDAGRARLPPRPRSGSARPPSSASPTASSTSPCSIESGQGVPKDLQAAYKWFALAARNGDKEAARRLGQVKAQLAAAEVAAAEATGAGLAQPARRRRGRTSRRGAGRATANSRDAHAVASDAAPPQSGDGASRLHLLRRRCVIAASACNSAGHGVPIASGSSRPPRGHRGRRARRWADLKIGLSSSRRRFDADIAGAGSVLDLSVPRRASAPPHPAARCDVPAPQSCGRECMHFYLPVAEMSANIFMFLAMGGAVGFLSGLFGVGGGFLMTPLLIFSGIPPAVAVGTEAAQILASSVSGALAQWRRRNIDVTHGHGAAGGRRRRLGRPASIWSACCGGWACSISSSPSATSPSSA